MFICTGQDASRLSKCCLLAPRTTTTGIVTRETPLLLFICTTNTNERAAAQAGEEDHTERKDSNSKKRVGRPEGCHCQPSGQDRRASRVSAPPDRTVENYSRPAQLAAHEPDGNASLGTAGTPGLAIAWGPWLQRVHRLHGTWRRLLKCSGTTRAPSLACTQETMEYRPVESAVRYGVFGQIKGGNKMVTTDLYVNAC